MVVVIVAILAAIAIPNYIKTVERGYRREAQDLLLTIYHGERAYFFAENEYKVGAVTMDDWRKIFTDSPNLESIPVEFVVDVGGTGDTKSFLVTATRKNASKNNLTIDQDRRWCGGDENPDNGSCLGSWPP